MADRAIIVTDMSYGDAGKGTTVDYLVRQAQSAVVIRHSGGAQAAHNVMTPDGRHHTFAQFGSGSFVPDVVTHLSRFMLINPLNMLLEADELVARGINDIWERTTVDEAAVLITPWHASANRLRELARNNGRHGSCGQGIGETRSDALRNPAMVMTAAELDSPRRIARRLRAIRDTKYEQLKAELGKVEGAQATDEWQLFHDESFLETVIDGFWEWQNLVTIVDKQYLRDLMGRHELAMFEGSQGVLLDEDYGFHPYTTWSKTTHVNALMLLDETRFTGHITRLGVVRAYTTRHGPGPFVTEDVAMTRRIPDYHNRTGNWQGAFRVGVLDLVAHRYALDACSSADQLVVTGLDRLEQPFRYCDRYELKDGPDDAERFFRFAPDGMICAIKVGPTNDRPYQARLTELLLLCNPVYQALPAAPDQQDNFLRTIEDHLGLPIALTSFGPTAADKRARVAL